ncbi:MAG: hypothetical protein QOF94_24 [Acidobacteriaceae bacterium]
MEYESRLKINGRHFAHNEPAYSVGVATGTLAEATWLWQAFLEGSSPIVVGMTDSKKTDAKTLYGELVGLSVPRCNWTRQQEGNHSEA